jgi:HEAT repeat protein
MADEDLQNKAIDALVLLNTAIKNMQLYPPASPTIASSLDRFYKSVLEILKMETPLIFAESEKRILVREKQLNQKEQETTHVTSILDILLNLGVKEIIFNKGLKKEEAGVFIKLLAQKPETIFKDGGLAALIAKNKIVNIYIDKKVFVAMDKNMETVSGKHQEQSTSGSDKFANNDMINRVTDYLLNDNSDKRDQASTELTAIIESLPPEDQRNLIKTFSSKLIDWIRLETLFTPAYKKICSGLQKLAQNFILEEQFADAIPIMNVFSEIYTEKLKKDDQIREVSTEALKELASEGNVQILFRELNTNDNKQRTEAGEILAQYDDIILNKLMDMVKDVKDSDERVRIIHLIRKMGHKSIPAIKERISNINAPWYYLRNLAYILGHVGNESSAYILHPLLLHKNEKVRMEALKSIYNTGGNQRGQLLLSVLPQADDELRLNIVEMLGKLKCTNAVVNLVDILKNKSLTSKDEHLTLQLKVCDALGAIGSTDAIPFLLEIAESKSFLGIGSYPTEVKYAAKRALATIKRKQEEEAKLR